jgi:type IV secretion system protein VirB6
MDNCTALNPAAGSAQTMVNTVDCTMQTTVQSAYANLLGGGGAFGQGLTIALTLYVAFLGYRLIFGRSSLSMSDLVPRMVMIGALLALTSSWATYQTLIYDTLTDGPQEIASTLIPGANKGSITARVDTLSERMVDLADAWTEFDARVEPAQTGAMKPDEMAKQPLPTMPTGAVSVLAPKDSLGPNMLLISALLLILASTGVLVVAKVILGLLLILGPVFAVFALFETTRGLTLGWGKASALMAIVPLMTMLTAAGATALIEPLLADMYVAAGRGDFSLRQALAIMVIVIIMGAVAIQLFRIGRTIVSGWTLSFGKPGHSKVGMSPLAFGPNTDNRETANVVFNERIQSMIGALDRPNQGERYSDLAVQRAILLPQTNEVDSFQPRGEDVGPNRKIASGTNGATRAPIKPFRIAA